jgi:hypothetical protein
MKHIEIKGLENATVAATQRFACASNWLLVGDDEGQVHVADLHSASVVAKYRHGAGSNDDAYRGITAVHAIAAPCTANHDFIGLSGCSDGLIKIWQLPNQRAAHSPWHGTGHVGGSGNGRGNASLITATTTTGTGAGTGTVSSSSSALVKKTFGDWIGGAAPTVSSSVQEEKIRIKPAMQAIKLHHHRITCFAGDVYANHHATHMGWIAAAGDARGGVSVLRHVHENEVISQKMAVFTPAAYGAGSAAGSASSSTKSGGGGGGGGNGGGGGGGRGGGGDGGGGGGADRHLVHDAISTVAFFSCGVTQGASNMVMNVVKHHYGGGATGASAADRHAGAGAAGGGGAGAGGQRGGSDPLLALGTTSGLIAVVDINAGKSIFTAEGHASQVTKLVPVKQNVFLSAGYDRMMKLWDVRMRHAISTVGKMSATGGGGGVGGSGGGGGSGAVGGTAATAASSLLGGAATGVGGTAGGAASASAAAATGGSKLYEERSLGGYMLKRCASAAISEVVVGGWDNALVISASADGQLRMWDLKYDLHNPCTTIDAHRDRVTSILWNNQEEFYTSSYDGFVCAWDSIHARCTYRLQVFGSHVEGITQLQMTDFYHKVASTLPLPESASQAAAAAAAAAVAAAATTVSLPPQQQQQQQLILHRQCLVASGWLGTLRVYAHDHFVQSNKS